MTDVQRQTRKKARFYGELCALAIDFGDFKSAMRLAMYAASWAFRAHPELREAEQ